MSPWQMLPGQVSPWQFKSGNDSSGQYFHSYFPLLFPYVTTLSHRKSAWIKILNLQKLIRAHNNLPFETPSAILCPLANILNFAGGSMFLLGYWTLGSAFDKCFFYLIIPSMRTSKIQNGHQGASKWPTRSWKWSTPRILGTPVNFCSISFLIRALRI